MIFLIGRSWLGGSGDAEFQLGAKAPPANAHASVDFGLSRTLPSRRSRRVTTGELARWHEIESAQETFAANFKRDVRPGLVRAKWINSTTVRFWLDRLSSSDPKEVEFAIQVLEKAAVFDPGELLDSNGEWVPANDPFQRNQLIIHNRLRDARTEAIKQRRFMNSALETAKTNADIARIEHNFFVDSDDGMFLRDAEPVIRSFVPRLDSSDPVISESAAAVLNKFTFDLFADEDAEWWNAAMAALDRKDLGKILE